MKRIFEITASALTLLACGQTAETVGKQTPTPSAAGAAGSTESDTGPVTADAGASSAGRAASNAAGVTSSGGQSAAGGAAGEAGSASAGAPTEPIESGGFCSDLSPLPAASDQPRPSSFVPCENGCDFGEACDSTVVDILCVPETPCGPEDTGDGLCHRVCSDDLCGPDEHCEDRTTLVSDTGMQVTPLCLCDDDACPERGPGGEPWPPEGGIEAFRNETPLPFDVYYHAAAASDDFLFASGGLTIDELTDTSATLAHVDAVLSAPIQSDGSLGDWEQAGTLEEPAIHHGMAAFAGRLYVAGGQIQQDFVDGVASAPIESDGSLGDWREEAPLPGVRAWHQLMASHGVLIVAGGSSDESYFTDADKSVYFSEIDSDGSLRGWQTAPAPGHYDGGAAVFGERLYVVDDNGSLGSIAIDDLVDGASEFRRETIPPLSSYVDFLASGWHTVRLLGLCDTLLITVPDGIAVIAPVDSAGIVGTFQRASRVYGPATGYAAVSAPNGRAYVLGGTNGRIPIRRVDGVWSTARQ